MDITYPQPLYLLGLSLLHFVLESAPNFAAWHSNLGNVLEGLHRLEEALASYDRAIALEPDFIDANYNHGRNLLRQGNFAQGWEKFEYRWKSPILAKNVCIPRNFLRPLWLGNESLHGKTILLHAEQGLGDTLQFCRYIACVVATGARVIVEVPEPLIYLLHASIAGVAHWYAKGVELPDFDYHCPLLSLPLAFHTRLGTIPAQIPYLCADANKVQHWQLLLGGKTKPRIGLAWSGRPEHQNDHNRSLRLADLIAYLPAQFDYVCLQKEVRDVDKFTLQTTPQIRSFCDALTDFTDTAALIQNMDLIISVDTSIAHLAGALGKPLWLLLLWVPDWRWMLDRTDSPWYPSARLFRQPARGDWAQVLQQIGEELLMIV